MDNFKIGGMMKQLMQMQKQLKKAQKELEKESVVGKAGDGAVQVTINGNLKCKNIVLDAEKISGLHNDILEQQIMEAFNQALEKARALMTEKMGPMAANIPGLN